MLKLAADNSNVKAHTLATGKVHFWSRSRGKLWLKGETSGNFLELAELRVDCDNDCVLAKVHQRGGAACHTGFRSCFYKVVEGGKVREEGVKVFDPKSVYGEKA